MYYRSPHLKSRKKKTKTLYIMKHGNGIKPERSNLERRNQGDESERTIRIYMKGNAKLKRSRPVEEERACPPAENIETSICFERERERERERGVLNAKCQRRSWCHLFSAAVS